MRAIIILILLVGQTAGAACFPPNAKWVPRAVDVQADRVAKTAFDDAIRLVQMAYAPDVAAKGAKLVINNLWSDGTVNSQAYQQGRNWYVDAFGGLARYKGVTKSAFIAVLCHEVGHHIGGRPRYGRDTDWASVEGQADYWATLACMKRVDPGHIRAASLALAKVLADLGGEPVPRVSTPDRSVVSVTYEDHPAAQCRLDTYIAGINTASRPRCWFAQE